MKKIPTLFKPIYENNKRIGVENVITEGCEDAFLNGIATIEADGAACAIIEGEFYKRYDAKNSKPVPEGAIKCQEEPDPVTGHLPCWVKCSRLNPDDRWFWYAHDVAQKEMGALEDGTYEAIGKHFRNNPYGLEHDTLYRHGSESVKVTRTFNGVRRFLEFHKVEGLVFWLNGEPICKIKRSDFGLNWEN